MNDAKSRERRNLDRVAGAIMIAALLSLGLLAGVGAYSLVNLVF